MSMFQMTVELSRLFPVQAFASITYDAIMKLARDIRKSGSDLLIEADLSAIFGRGRINHKIQTEFKNQILREVTIQPLYPDTDMCLSYGPGPTANHAIKSRDQAHLATVIQLSMLLWFHQRTDFTAALSECISNRFRLGYPGANPDPGFEGIEATLRAISSQTSAFSWGHLSNQVESKLRAAYPEYICHQALLQDLFSLHPNQLLAAMDMLYMVQSLPEDRKIMVSNQRGLITLVVWAHFLLSLTVVVRGLPNGDLTFGDADAQVIICWVKTPSLSKHTDVCLLDSTMDILLKPETEFLSVRDITGEERHSIQGYGTHWLRRMCNSIVSIKDDDPMYREVANYVTAMAYKASTCLSRKSPTPPPEDEAPIIVDRWQLVSAAQLLFHGIGIDTKMIDVLIGKAPDSESLESFPLPKSFEIYLGKIHSSFQHLALTNLEVPSLVCLVLLVSNIYDLQACAEAPLVSDLGAIGSDSLVESLWKTPFDTNGSSIFIEEYAFFDTFATLLQGTSLRDDVEESGDTIFVKSDFGWSLILDAVGDKDPGDVRPWMLHLKKGVPTNRATGERKYRMKDFIGHFERRKVPDRAIYDRKQHFVPRCVTNVTKRSEFFTARRDAFLSVVRLEVREETENTMVKMTQFDFRDGEATTLSLGFREAHQALWGARLTAPCRHTNNTQQANLGGEVVTTNSLNWKDEGLLPELDPNPVPERVCVLLVKGDKRARWLALCEAALNSRRRVLLRCRRTCEDCAINLAVASKGKWLVII